VVVGVFVVAVLMGLAIVLSGPLDDGTRMLLNDVGLVIGGLGVVTTAGLAATRGPVSQRRAWRLLAIGAAFAVVGNEWYLLVGVMGWERIASLGDLCFLISGIFSVWGLVSFPAIPRRGLELVRMVLDGVVVGGSVMLTTAVWAIAPVLATGQNPFRRMDTVGLMIVDVTVATVAVLLLIRGDRADRPVLLMLALGFAVWAATDLARWVYTVRSDAFFQTPLPVGWMAGYALIAIAALLPGRIRQSDAPTGQKQDSPITDTILTFGLLLVAAFANATSRPAVLTPWAGVLWFLLVAAVVARQVLLITDNERLRRTLERRVDVRTQELASMTRQSELLLNSVGDGIYGVDSRGVITFINPSGARTLGYSAEELIGRHAHDQFHARHTDGRPYDYQNCYIAEAISAGHTTSGEEDFYVGADGREIPVEVTSSPLHSDTRTPGAVIVFRDITSRREVDRMKREFVSVVSHELRTPLTAIRGSLGLLSGDRLGELSPRARRMIRIALDSTERLGRLVNDILDIERMESGSMPMDFRDHEALELVQTAVSQVRPIAAEAGVRITIELVTGHVNADADRIVQTLVNLIGNAIKFSPPRGLVQVGAQPVPGSITGAEESSMVIFWVADEGRGIPEDKLERIFERFEQVDSSDGREMGGSGLGLSISRSIIERHGGRIWAESPPGSGAVFQFMLPRVDPSSEPSSEPAGEPTPTDVRSTEPSEQPVSG
jgi:PAS domain S-box-containing protein